MEGWIDSVNDSINEEIEKEELLGQRYFNDDNYYSVTVDETGVTVYSECCADKMSHDTAMWLRDRLNELYLDGSVE